MILVGTSGWQYDEWRGGFYPAGLPKRAWLSFFASRFPVVEVNNSFYRLPSKDTFSRWRDETPPGFVIAPKLSRFVTHIRRLRDCEEPLKLFLDNARGLGTKLGPLLVQLPPRFPADPERLRAFLRLMPRRVRAAVEFRDRSWERDDVFEILDAVGAAFVIPDRPGLRVPSVVTGGWSYIRFHQGREDAPGYARDKLRRWADRISSMPAKDTYVFFNNDERGAAVRDALTLTDFLKRPPARRR